MRAIRAGIITFSSAVKSAEQIMELEDEAELVIAELRQPPVVQRKEVLILEQHFAAGRCFEAAEYVQQGGFADAGLPD